MSNVKLTLPRSFEFHVVWSTRCFCIALSYLDVVIKDYYFEVYPRFSLLCAPWQKTRPNSKRRPFTSFCFVRFFKSLVCSWVLSLAASGLEPSCPPFAAQPSRRSQEMTTPPSTANPSPPARLWLNARRPASWLNARRPASWLNARRPASDSSPPDCRWLKPAGRRWQGKPTRHLATSVHAAVRGSPTPPFAGDHGGESQPTVGGSL